MAFGGGFKAIFVKINEKSRPLVVGASVIALVAFPTSVV
jgi:hypothetical protein